MGAERIETAPQGERLKCDYLVVGAGTAGLSFVDTLLAEDAAATVVVVDRNASPGGHWTGAYPFVRLHQPSCFYGVNSLPLGGVKFDLDDRATGGEVLAYYARLCDGWHASGRVHFFFGAEYGRDDRTGAHTIAPAAYGPGVGGVVVVDCRKLVTVASDLTVPSMRGPLVPVAEGVAFVPVNELPARMDERGDDGSARYERYVVFGAGKTGVDAVVHLLRGGVDPARIAWVVSRDNWYFVRDAMADFYGMMAGTSKRLLAAKSAKECFLDLEKDGMMCRLDPDGPCPHVYRGALVGLDELAAIRSVRDVVRHGRATSIELGRVVLERGSLAFDPQRTLLVDCMVDNMYGYLSFSDDFRIFEPGRINLGPTLAAGNFSFSSAHIAFLECALKDDSSKNSACYFLRGKYLRDGLDAFLGYMYMQVKAFDALLKVKGGMKFMMSSRTNMNAPAHHKWGILGMMWNFFGPRQLHRFGKRLTRKVESGGFDGIDHFFGIETLDERGDTKQMSHGE